MALGNAFSRRMWRRLIADRWALLNAFVLAAFVLAAVSVGFGLVASDWNDRVGASFEGPSFAAPLGTDYLGRSVARKALYGAKVSVSVGMFAALLAIGIGGILGLAAGYCGGWLDDVVVWLYSTLSSVPGILLMCAVTFVIQDAAVAGVSLQGIPAMCLALGLTHWVGTCRLIRSEVIRQRESEYVSASIALGGSNWHIMRWHMLPQILHLVIFEGFIQCVGFIRAEVMLSYLGLGPIDQPSWGVMLDDARLELERNMWLPMVAVSVLILVFSYSVYYMGKVARGALGGAE